MRILIVLLCLSCLNPSISLSDCRHKLGKLGSTQTKNPAQHVSSLFKKHFKDKYTSDECYENTIRFLERATQETEAPFFLVSIENLGPSTLGMIQAKKARGTEFRKSQGGWIEIPASIERKWMHHVFAMDSQSNVFDFDYTHQPTVVDLKHYLETMFLDEPKDLRAKKLEDYRVTISRAEYALREEMDPDRTVLSLKDFLGSGLSRPRK